MPFGYLEFSRAIRDTMRARAPPLAAAALVPVSGRARVRVPVRFFLNRVSQVWVTADHTRSAIQIRTAQRNGCQQTATNSWAVAV